MIQQHPLDSTAPSCLAGVSSGSAVWVQYWINLRQCVTYRSLACEIGTVSRSRSL